MRTFAKVFEELLRDRKLTHREAADRLTAPLRNAGVLERGAGALDFRQISRWVTGKNIPSPKTLCVIADFFTVSVDFLLGRSDTTATTLGSELAAHVAAQLAADPVWTKALGGRVARTRYVADGTRLLKFVVAMARASELADRHLQATEGTTLSLHNDLRTATQSLEKAANALHNKELLAEAEHYRRTIKRVDKALAQQLAPRIIGLFDAPSDAPLPAMTISTAAAVD